jgi:hypothetical protein
MESPPLAAHYLPLWSSRGAAAAGRPLPARRRDAAAAERADQPPWCPEFDGQTKVSSLQTGVFAGPVGSPVGQHLLKPEAVAFRCPGRVWPGAGALGDTAAGMESRTSCAWPCRGEELPWPGSGTR